jgi:biopolymer transport protein ExbD
VTDQHPRNELPDDSFKGMELLEGVEGEGIDEEGSVLPRRPVDDTVDMDITPMIDVVFLLLIFFIVSSNPDQQTAVELPRAHYGSGVSEMNSVVITVAEQPNNKPAEVYLADGKKGSPLPNNPDQQETAIIAYVNDGVFNLGKANVILKAERGVKYKDVSRVGAAAGSVEGVQLYLAVFEKK